MSRYDKYGFLKLAAINILGSPDFNAEGSSVDNFVKTLTLINKISENEDKSVKIEKQVDVMSIDMINKLAGATYNKAEDGRRFGDKRKTTMIQAKDVKVEEIESSAVDD